MNGKDLIAAIDASTPRLRKRVPAMPLREIGMLRLVRAANQALSSYLDLVLRPLGFTEGTLHTLFLLFASEHGTGTPGSLCELLGQTKANMTRILDALIAKRYVSRRIDASDGRRQIIRITQDGRRLVRRIAPEVFVPLAKSMSELSAEELGALDSLLRRFVLSLDQQERQLWASLR